MSSSILKITLLVLLLSVLELGLVVAIMPTPIIHVPEWVQSQLSNMGVRSHVTALLLNYRGYDTLLAMVILLVAQLGVWIVYRTTNPSPKSNSPLVQPLPRWMLPLLILTLTFVLWASINTPDSGFIQLGAVLASLGALVKFIPFLPPKPIARFPLRLLLGSGLLIFFGIAVMFETIYFPQYPLEWMVELMLVIAISLMIVIGLIMLLIGTPGLSWHHSKSAKKR